MDPTGPLCLYVLFQHEWTAAGSRAIFSREKTSTGQYKAVKRKPGQPCLILPYLPVCSLLLLRLVTGKRVWQRRLSRHQYLWTLKCNVNIPMLCIGFIISLYQRDGMSTRALSILSIKSMLWSHNFQLRMLLEHTEHAVSLTNEVQHSTCHGSIAPACSASSPTEFSVQLNVLLVLTTIQLMPCTNYIKLIQVWFSSYIPTTRFHDLPGW